MTLMLILCVSMSPGELAGPQQDVISGEVLTP